jgi:hypothetical protein
MTNYTHRSIASILGYRRIIVQLGATDHGRNPPWVDWLCSLRWLLDTWYSNSKISQVTLNEEVLLTAGSETLHDGLSSSLHTIWPKV